MRYLYNIFFISQEIIWSVGTSYWATASRHYVTSLGLLTIFSTLLFVNTYSEKNLNK